MNKPEPTNTSVGDSPRGWMQWRTQLPLIGTGMLLLAYLIPIPITHARNFAPGRIYPKTATLWLIEQWGLAGGWGKLTLLLLPVLLVTFGYAATRGSRVRRTAIMSVSAGLAFLVASIWLLSLAEARTGGYLPALYLIVFTSTFAMTVGGFASANDGRTLRRVRRLAAAGGVLAGVLLLYPLSASAPFERIPDDASTLFRQLVDGLTFAGGDVPHDAPEPIRNAIETARCLAFFESLLFATVFLTAIGGLVCVLPGATGSQAFVIWRRVAPAVLIIALFCQIAFAWISPSVSAMAIQSVFESEASVSARDHLLLERDRMENSGWMGAKNSLALWGAVLLVGTTFAAATSSWDEVVSHLRRTSGRPVAPTPSAPPGVAKSELTPTKLAAELEAVEGMLAKGWISDEDAERMRSRLLGRRERADASAEIVTEPRGKNGPGTGTDTQEKQ